MKMRGRLLPAAKVIRRPLGENPGVCGATRPEALVMIVLRFAPSKVMRPTFVTWRAGLQPWNRSQLPFGEKVGSESHSDHRLVGEEMRIRPEPSGLTSQMPLPGRTKAIRPFRPGRVAPAVAGQATAAITAGARKAAQRRRLT